MNFFLRHFRYFESCTKLYAYGLGDALGFRFGIGYSTFECLLPADVNTLLESVIQELHTTANKQNNVQCNE